MGGDTTSIRSLESQQYTIRGDAPIGEIEKGFMYKSESLCVYFQLNYLEKQK